MLDLCKERENEYLKLLNLWTPTFLCVKWVGVDFRDNISV